MQAAIMAAPFWSMGVDCFAPLNIKIGRIQENRWEILFKCITTHYTHIEVLTGLTTDSFLMFLHCFIAHRGRPFELLPDWGTKFKGAEKELKEAFSTLSSTLTNIWKENIHFHFNPLNASHWGSICKTEVRSIKTQLRVVLGTQTVTEVILITVLD